ncbi:MAG: hypothetical protein UY87_C0007G0028, partial [Candidatus Peribacteria bacterium GW2011_GWC2_54_8]
MARSILKTTKASNQGIGDGLKECEGKPFV